MASGPRSPLLVRPSVVVVVFTCIATAVPILEQRAEQKYSVRLKFLFLFLPKPKSDPESFGKLVLGWGVVGGAFFSLDKIIFFRVGWNSEYGLFGVAICLP